ncbi:MAG: preprotein translocase subunit SecY, partial [Clostridiaceae bacterium]|nr:preprotein translocase subunit SecY [Clostridiaceae bacterium]
MIRLAVNNIFGKWYYFILLLVYVIASIVFVVIFDSAERRITVQYAKRVVGRRQYGGQSTHIPIKVAMAGVIPIIFAISIMSFPSTLAQLFNAKEGSFLSKAARLFTPDNWLYIILYFALIVGFTFFYTSITFNPIEIANNMKKNGGSIPGIRAGKPTSDYITKVLSKITFAGSLFLAIIAVLPNVISLFYSNFSRLALGGTSLLIVVGVALETFRQLEAQMLMRHYKGFLS